MASLKYITNKIYVTELKVKFKKYSVLLGVLYKYSNGEYFQDNILVIHTGTYPSTCTHYSSRVLAPTLSYVQ